MPKPRSPADQLANMPIDDLIDLKAKIDDRITEMIRTEKKALLQKLQEIRRFEAKVSPITDGKSRSVHDRAKATPKYRNPLTGETWAGRGLQPKWMRNAIESGHTQDEFLIVKR